MRGEAQPERAESMNPDTLPGLYDLWFLPLGGTGEIGMNLNLYGHDGRWLMVDLGVTFARAGQGGPDVQMADPAYITARRKRLDAIIITHAHEDHVGAVHHLWRRLQVPVYTTRFTAIVLERKLAEAGLAGRVPINVVEPGARRQIGAFDVEWIPLTHSVPESHALVIRTPAGSVFHTADWKLDAKPVVGAAFPERRYRALAAARVDAMVCDSTNALTCGGPTFEGDLFEPLARHVRGAEGRVIVSCFGSNIARLDALARLADEHGRYFGALGRSMGNMLSAARGAGLWRGRAAPASARELGYLPRHEVLAAATGSQGEPRTALDRLAGGNHPDMELEPGDTVIFSSRVIPGNEPAVARLVERLERLGVTVVTDDDPNAPIHASGHPTREELADMYGWVRPALAIPVHGEPAHLNANAEIAKRTGVRHTLVGRNGDLFRICPRPALEHGFARTGRLGTEGGTLVEVPSHLYATA